MPSFLLSGAVDLAEGYTTNAGGTTRTGKPDTFERGQLDLGLHYQSRRFKADAHYSLTGYYYNRFHDFDQLANRLNLTATSELIPDHLFLNVNSFAAPTTLSRLGTISAAPGLIPNVNSHQTYGYTANPVFRMRFGDYATSESSLNESQIFFVPSSVTSPDPGLGITQLGNTSSTSATERIASGPSFGRLKWDLTASYTNIDQTTQTLQETVATAEFAYAITRAIAPLAIIGYDRFESSVPLTQDLPSLVALGGFRYSYGPTFNLVVAAGESHGFPTYIGSLNWDATAKFKIVGSLTDTITTPEAGILNNLATLAVSAAGVFSNSQPYYWQTAAQALNPQFATVSPVPLFGLSLDNSINHERQGQLTLLHTDERTQYGLTLFGAVRDRLNVITTEIPSRSSVYGVGVNVSRKLRRDLTGFASASYSLANEFGGNDRIISATAGLSYAVSKNLDAYLTGYYVQRQSSGQIVVDPLLTGPLSNAVVMIGIRRRLGSGQ